MDEKKPLRKDGILTRKMGDEWMLYDSEKGDIHVINSTAEFVWRMCDGSHSVGAIKSHMQDTYEVPAGVNINEDIEGIIKNFGDLGVLK